MHFTIVKQPFSSTSPPHILCVDKIGSRPRGNLCVDKIGSVPQDRRSPQQPFFFHPVLAGRPIVSLRPHISTLARLIIEYPACQLFGGKEGAKFGTNKKEKGSRFLIWIRFFLWEKQSRRKVQRGKLEEVRAWFAAGEVKVEVPEGGCSQRCQRMLVIFPQMQTYFLSYRSRPPKVKRIASTPMLFLAFAGAARAESSAPRPETIPNQGSRALLVFPIYGRRVHIKIYVFSYVY